MPRLAQGITDTMQLTVKIDQGPRIERLELEGRIIQNSPGFGVRGLQDLKTPVQKKALYLVGPHPSADPVRGFQNQEGNMGLM